MTCLLAKQDLCVPNYIRDYVAAKPTKPSRWWMLLLIIPVIATGLAVVASQFQPARWTLFKNFRRRWTNWQARLAGHLNLIGDNITQWSRRASRPIQIDPTCAILFSVTAASG
jgi:hypothetical protein